MTIYVGQEKFFDWYAEKAKEDRPDKNRLLQEVLTGYTKTRSETYVLPADKTKSGNDEKYDFRFENVGCCGASTFYIYF